MSGKFLPEKLPNCPIGHSGHIGLVGHLVGPGLDFWYWAGNWSARRGFFAQMVTPGLKLDFLRMTDF